VRAFRCDVCTARVAFENNRCLSCGSELGYSVTAGRVVALLDVAGAPGFRPAGPGGEAPVERRCANAGIAACTWVVPEDVPSGLCLSCRLTRTRPDDDDVEALAAFAKTEAAKRRLVHQLLDLGLPVVPRTDGGDLAFDLLSSRHRPVTTGHADGVVTLDLAEGDDSHREAVRADLGEPYRTLLGHLRHEIGHYYWRPLTGEPPAVESFRALFGDERADYAAAVQRHYEQGPPPGWRDRYVSAYATMHPWEDWAETFSHYLHLRDVLQTARAYGLSVHGDRLGGVEDLAAGVTGIEELVKEWLPLSYGLNAVNRSMGKDDLYPFVLTPPVIAKLGAVHGAVTSGVRRPL
jgi:hypothetical protein